MPQRDHSSVLPAEPQSTAERDWQRLVAERLPADLEDQAEALKAFQRARGLPSALHLLRGLLYYVLSHASLRDVSVWSRLIGLTSTVISHKPGTNAYWPVPTGSCGSSMHCWLLPKAALVCSPSASCWWTPRTSPAERRRHLALAHGL